MVISVEELLWKPFGERCDSDKVQIVREGKPRPTLSLRKTSENDLDAFSSLFSDENVYNQVKWLTGCEIKREVFCWPCLLFSAPNKWNTGISDISYALENIKHHDKEAEHLEAVFKLHMFVLQCTGKSYFDIDRIQHNKVVEVEKGNRGFVKCVFGAICLAAREQSLDSRLNDFKFRQLEMANCSKHLGAILKYCLEERYPDIINDLVDAATAVIRKAIANDAKKSSFVSMILGEQVVGEEKSQISTVLRFTKNGKVCERFIGFSNEVGCARLYRRVENHIVSTMKNFEISDKLLSLSLDGALLSRVNIINLMKSLESRWFFVPCAFQGFGRVLMESLSHFEEYKSFFKTYRDIERYFKVEKNFKMLEYIMHEKTAVKLREYWMNFPFIIILSSHRTHFVEYLNKRILQCTGHNAAGEIMLKNFLQDLNNIFLIKLLKNVFSDYFDGNFSFISKPYGVREIDKAFGGFTSHLQQIRDEGFEDLWKDIAGDIDENCTCSGEPLKHLNYQLKTDRFNLFQRIMDNLINDVSFRNKELCRLSFCDMLLHSQIGYVPFHQYHVCKLLQKMGSFFDANALNSEIGAILADKPSIFTDKTIHQLLEVFLEYDLRDVFGQLYKLNELILTLPLYPPLSPTNEQSLKFYEIDRFAYIPEQSGVPTGDASVLYIENDLLQELKQSESFVEDVIREFYQMNKNIAVEMT